MQRLQSTLFVAFVFLTGSAESCGPEHVIEDSGFDLWCGEALCSWELEQGSVQRSPSWHSSDPAVELSGESVAISQLSEKGWPEVECIRFEMLADFDEDARVVLELDFYDDGLVDLQQDLAQVRWEPIVHRFRAPVGYRGVRIRLKKSGAGRARIAQLEATSADQCPDSPIALPKKAEGARCAEDEECASGLCETFDSGGTWHSVCSACNQETECGPGSLCGIKEPSSVFYEPYLACVPEARRKLGELCTGDAECTTDTCCNGRCSTCCGPGGCEAGMVCDVALAESSLAPPYMPFICKRDGGNPPGGECVSGGDCKSGTCSQGTELSLCLYDGRSCTAAAECPSLGLEELSVCQSIGYSDGQCE